MANNCLQVVLPAAEALGYTLPDACPLVPSQDRFGSQEQSKSQLGDENWKCGLCDKVRLAAWQDVVQPPAAVW